MQRSTILSSWQKEMGRLVLSSSQLYPQESLDTHFKGNWVDPTMMVWRKTLCCPGSNLGATVIALLAHNTCFFKFYWMYSHCSVLSIILKLMYIFQFWLYHLSSQILFAQIHYAEMYRIFWNKQLSMQYTYCRAACAQNLIERTRTTIRKPIVIQNLDFMT